MSCPWLLVSCVLSCPGVSSVWHAGPFGDRYCVRPDEMAWGMGRAIAASQGRAGLACRTRGLSQSIATPERAWGAKGWLACRSLIISHGPSPSPAQALVLIWLYLDKALAPEGGEGRVIATQVLGHSSEVQ